MPQRKIMKALVTITLEVNLETESMFDGEVAKADTPEKQLEILLSKAQKTLETESTVCPGTVIIDFQAKLMTEEVVSINKGSEDAAGTSTK